MRKLFNDITRVLSRHERNRFYELVVLSTIINILDIFSLAVLLVVVNFYIDPADTTLQFLPDRLANHRSPALIALFVLLFSLKNLFAHWVTRLQFLYAYNVATRISKHQLLHYFKADYAEHTHTDSSVYIRKIGQQPAEYCQYVLMGLQQIISQSILAGLAISGILLFKAKIFFLLLLILLPPVFIATRFMKKELKTVRTQTRLSSEKALQHLKEALNGYIESNMYHAENFFTSRYELFQKELNNHLASLQIVQSLPARMIEVFAILGLFVLILINQWTGANAADLITIGAFIAATYKIIPGIVKVINLSGQISAYRFSIDGLTIDDNSSGLHKNEFGKHTLDSIQLKNIKFQYGDRLILNDFSFCVERKDFIVIAGRSGIGKTTILNLLLGFLSPADGNILINRKVVFKEGIARYRSRVSYSKQQNFLIHDTLLKNITLQTDNYDVERLRYAMEFSGLNKIIESWPDRLNAIITENGKNISGGQRQRITLARALYKDFDLLILDEPFSELDEDAQCGLIKNLKQIAGSGKMIILITHDKRIQSSANKIVSLDEG